MDNIYKMFKVPEHEAWIVHNDYLEVSKRFISAEGARKYKNKMNKELDFDNQQNRNDIGNNAEGINNAPEIGGTDKTGSVDELNDAEQKDGE